MHDPALVRPLDADEVARWAHRHDLVGVVTVSPHTADAPEQIRRIRTLGVSVSLGHTHATTDQLRAAVDAGATLAPISVTDPVAAAAPPERPLDAARRGPGHRRRHRRRSPPPRRGAHGHAAAKGVDRMYIVSDSTALAGRRRALHHAGRRAGRRQRRRAAVVRRHGPAGRCRRRPRLRTAPPRRRSRPGLGVGAGPGHRHPGPRRLRPASASRHGRSAGSSPVAGRTSCCWLRTARTVARSRPWWRAASR